MNDRTRFQLAALCSGALHLLFVGVVAYAPHGGPSALASVGEPIIVQLRPENAERPREENRRLVAPGMPTSEPVPSTDLISTQNSKASDLSNSDKDGHAPAVDLVDVFDAPGGGTPKLPAAVPPSPAETKAPDEAAAPAPSKAPALPEAPPESTKPVTPIHAAPPKSDADAVRAEKPVKPDPSTPKKAPEKPTPPQEDLTIAKAEPPMFPQIPPSIAPAPTPGPSHGRVDGGVKTKGFLGFEAERNEFAPYLQAIQRKVEARWRSTLQMKYSGVSQTQAVIDCSIRPDGKLEMVQIIDPGNSVTYAPLCKEAIEKAGPFSPFPFTVPEVYRSKNLEIRWTFSFM